MNLLIGKARRRIAREVVSLRRFARQKAARTIYSFPSFAELDPRHRITTFKRYCRLVGALPNGTESALQAWYLPLRADETVYRTAPVSVNEAAVASFNTSIIRYQYGKSFEMPEVFLGCMNDAKIYSKDFLVLSPDNQIFMESALSKDEVLEENGVLDTMLWPRWRSISGSFVLLATPWSDRYYFHWVLDALPRLAIIEQFAQLNSLPLIVPGKLTSFHHESLDLAGVSADRLFSFDGSAWQVDTLYFPQLLGPTGNPSPHAVAWLRSRFLSREPGKPAVAKRRIYLTRRDTSQRRVLNEEEIIDYLAGIGFEIVCPSQMSFSEQIRLFRNVEIVIAPHGGGSTNMVFAPKGATLIEFFGDNYINGCYWALTSICGQSYASLIGPSQWLDYSISLQGLKILLAKVCGT